MTNAKLEKLEDNLKILKSIKKNYTLKNIRSNKVDEWGLRYGLYESVKIIIDLAYHITAEKKLGTPKNYSECISFLILNNFINNDLGSKIIKLIGLRNLLIQEYDIIDAEALYKYLDQLDDISEFICATRKIEF